MKRFLIFCLLAIAFAGCKSPDTTPLSAKATVTKLADIPFYVARIAYTPNALYTTAPIQKAIYTIDPIGGKISVFQEAFNGTNLAAIATNNDQICFTETNNGGFYSYRLTQVTLSNAGTPGKCHSLKAAPGSPLTYIGANITNQLIRFVTSFSSPSVLNISPTIISNQLTNSPYQANAQLATNSKSVFVFCNHALWKLQSDNTLKVVAGVSGQSGYVDGDGATARFLDGGYAHGNAIAVDENDNVYVADCGSGCIRKVDASGNVTTVVGNKQYYNLPGATKDGNSNDMAFSFSSSDIALIPDGSLYVLADIPAVTNNFRYSIYKVVFK